MNHCDAASQETIRSISSSSLARGPSWSLGVRLEEPQLSTRTSTTSGEPLEESGEDSFRPPAELAHPKLTLEIPTVYLTKKESTSPSYHVYQLTIRLADGTEWSVYRRYSQFHTLHQQLKAKDPRISKLQFPPKRRLNSKASTIVQDRRTRLESYMRTLNNYIKDEATIMDGLMPRMQLKSLAGDESSGGQEPAICSPSDTNSLSDSTCSDQPNADFFLGQTTSADVSTTTTTTSSSEQLEKATIRSLFHTFIALKEKRDEHFNPASLNG